MAEPVRLALVGCGRIAQQHWNGVRLAPDGLLAVTAVVDVSRARAEAMAAAIARGGGGRAEVFLSVADALRRGGFEAVDVMLPHHLHLPVAAQCFAAGKHVLLEKPMAPTLADCDAILAAARASGRVFMVAENSQYWPEVTRAKEVIDSGAIGRVVSARAVFNGTFRPGDAAPITHGDVSTSMAVLAGDTSVPVDRPWRFDNAVSGGGIVIDGGAHWIRPLRILLGEIDAVTGVTARPLAAMDGESLARGLLRFRSGVVAYLECTLCGTVYGPDSSWRIMGTEGEVVVDSTVRLFNAANPSGRDMMEQKPAEYARLRELGVDTDFPGLSMPLRGYHTSFALELADFAGAVRGRAPAVPVATGLSQAEHSLGELRTAFALYRSARSGAWEPVWGERAAPRL